MLNLGSDLRPWARAGLMKAGYCFDAVHRPVQPSDRTNVPEPLRPENRPELFQVKPEADPPDLVEPFGLT